MTLVKICGLKTQEMIDVAAEAGADMVGLVFYPPSPRAITVEDAAVLSIPDHIKTVGLFVDPSDEELEAAMPHIDMIQLHGQEGPARVVELKSRHGKPIMKAFGISYADDISQAKIFENWADWLIFDAKVPGDLPGGTGKSFDWSLLLGMEFEKPWMLSGGLTPENVGEALSLLNPQAVDVSSGVEIERGVKDGAKIQDFINAVKQQD